MTYLSRVDLSTDELMEIGDRVAGGEVSPRPADHCDDVVLTLATGRTFRGSYRWDTEGWLHYEVEPAR